jgi:predicted phage terminase large subunit-like protein
VTTLDFAVGDDKWKSLRKKSLQDFYWFAAVVLGYGELIPMREGPHRLLCKFLSRTTGVPELDGAKYRKIEMPRETGKTTLAAQAYVIWRLVQYPDMSILIANERQENAVTMLGAIKAEFETNEFFRALFPECIPPDFKATTWSASAIKIPRATRRKEASVFTIGLGGTVTGQHPSEIIVDDIISREAMESARRGNWLIMEQANRWLHQLRPLLSSNALPMPSITFIGTRWWHNDVYEHIETAFGYGENPVSYNLKQRLDDGSDQIVPVYVVGDVAVFRRSAIENGRSMFPEKWSLEELAKIRVTDPSLFAANYLNAPSHSEMATFRDAWLRYFKWIDEKQIEWSDGIEKHQALVSQLDVVALVDPGGFSQSKSEDRARAACIIVGRKDGRNFILRAHSEKESYKVFAQQVVSFFGRYGVRKVRIELAAQQIAFIDLVKKLAGEAKLVLSWDTVTPGQKSKDERILELEPFFENGLIYLGTGPEFHEFMEQYRQFPRTRRVDLLDALSMGPTEWRRHSVRGQSPQERAAQELAQYRARRGLTPGRR